MNPIKTVPVVLVREADDASWYIELSARRSRAPRDHDRNGMSSKTTADCPEPPNPWRPRRRLPRRSPRGDGMTCPVHERLEELGVDRDRLQTALDSNENWGGMVHAFEFLATIGVVLDTWKEDT